MGLHVLHHVGESLAQAAHLGGEYHQDNQSGDADHHDKALDEVRLQCGHIASQHQYQGRGNGNDNHAHLFIDAQDHRAHAGQSLVHRSGVGNQKHEDHPAGEQPHTGALKPLFKELGHGFDVVTAGQIPGAVGQYQPGQQRTEDGVAHAHQAAPQAVVPAGAPGVADEHHRGEIGRAVGEGGDPCTGTAAAHSESGHIAAPPGIPYANAQHK